MSLVDPQLVKMIADLVIEALSKHTAAADVHPPAGLCTAGGGSDTSDNTPAVKPVTTSLQHDPQNIVPAGDRPHLSGIITLHQLEDAILSSPNKVVILAMDARLTPLAQDIVRANPTTIRRENVCNTNATLRNLNHGLPWYWWTCCNCDAVRQTVAERSNIMVPLTVPRRPASIVQAVMDADAAVRSGRAAGAVLFVRQAARAMCLTNRRRALRAIHGNCDEAVTQGIHEIGANVLVLEFPFLNYEQMSTRVDLIMRSKTKAPADVCRFLAEVEGAGL
jgi:hypothetical protein